MKKSSRSWRRTNSFASTAAARAGLSVPKFQLSDDGGALIVERFDRVDDEYVGFEDFCVLNALGTADKYKGGYETRIFRRMREFVSPDELGKSLEAFSGSSSSIAPFATGTRI